MKTILEVLQLSADYLKKKGLKNSRRDAEELIANVLSSNRLDLYLNFQTPLNDEELKKCREVICRRAAGEPVVYIEESLSFYGCKILVNSSVLIPRPETELLVDQIANQLDKENLQGKVLWDVCTGSGCIGIALKKKFPNLKVIVSDCSEKALEVARKNAVLNEVDVQFLLGDLLDPFKNLKTHFFVCNPPYVTEEEYDLLDSDVRDFEPKLALVSGKNGTEFYQRLARELSNYLFPQAKCWFEIGTGQGESVLSFFSMPPYKNLVIRADFAGHDRFFSLETE